MPSSSPCAGKRGSGQMVVCIAGDPSVGETSKCWGSPQPKLHTTLGPQLCQQGLGLLEVGRVKALGEPAVYLRQQLACRGPLPLPLPEPREAQGGAQLQCLGLLPAGDLEGLLETGFHLAHIGERALEEQLPLETIQLRFPPPLL